MSNNATDVLGLLDENVRDDSVSLANDVVTSLSPNEESIEDTLEILDKNSRAHDKHSLGEDCVDESSPTNPMEDANNPQLNDNANVSNDAFEVLPERENNGVIPEHVVAATAPKNNHEK